MSDSWLPFALRVAGVWQIRQVFAQVPNRCLLVYGSVGARGSGCGSGIRAGQLFMQLQQMQQEIAQLRGLAWKSSRTRSSA
jgi:hypothetical protein